MPVITMNKPEKGPQPEPDVVYEGQHASSGQTEEKNSAKPKTIIMHGPFRITSPPVIPVPEGKTKTLTASANVIDTPATLRNWAECADGAMLGKNINSTSVFPSLEWYELGARIENAIAQGAWITLFGPAGRGKSTLIAWMLTGGKRRKEQVLWVDARRQRLTTPDALFTALREGAEETGANRAQSVEELVTSLDPCIKVIVIDNLDDLSEHTHTEANAGYGDVSTVAAMLDELAWRLHERNGRVFVTRRGAPLEGGAEFPLEVPLLPLETAQELFATYAPPELSQLPEKMPGNPRLLLLCARLAVEAPSAWLTLCRTSTTTKKREKIGEEDWIAFCAAQLKNIAAVGSAETAVLTALSVLPSGLPEGESFYAAIRRATPEAVGHLLKQEWLIRDTEEGGAKRRLHRLRLPEDLRLALVESVLENTRKSFATSLEELVKRLAEQATATAARRARGGSDALVAERTLTDEIPNIYLLVDRLHERFPIECLALLTSLTDLLRTRPTPVGVERFRQMAMLAQASNSPREGDTTRFLLYAAELCIETGRELEAHSCLAQIRATSQYVRSADINVGLPLLQARLLLLTERFAEADTICRYAEAFCAPGTSWQRAIRAVRAEVALAVGDLERAVAHLPNVWATDAGGELNEAIGYGDEGNSEGENAFLRTPCQRARLLLLAAEVHLKRATEEDISASECQARLASARRCAERATSLYKEWQDVAGQGRAMRLLGEICLEAEQNEEAISWLDNAYTAAESVANRHERAKCLLALAELARRRGEREEAQTLCLEAETLFMTLGHRRGIVQALCFKGQIFYEQGKLELASHWYQQAAAIAGVLGLTDRSAEAIKGMAACAAAMGQAALAQALLERLSMAASNDFSTPVLPGPNFEKPRTMYCRGVSQKP
jgi:tetratricopeptide (TPR) repeat protein